MKIIATGLAMAFASAGLTACGIFSGQTYCLEEQEANGLDYMVVTDNSVCDNPNADAEYYTTNESFGNGDVVYVEADGSHSVKKKRKPEEIKKITTPPPYIPATRAPTICLKGYAPAPSPPKPAPAPANPAPVKPAPVVPAPKPQAPATVKPVTPAAPNTVKPGC